MSASSLNLCAGTRLYGFSARDNGPVHVEETA